MPALISTNTVQVVMKYRLGTEIMQNVYYVHKDDNWTQSDLDALNQAFIAWEEDTAAPLRSNQVALVAIKSTDLTSLTSPTLSAVLDDAIPGERINPAMPGNVTFAIKADIGERGRGRAGRKFWIGLSEDMCLENGCVEDIPASIQLAMETLSTLVAAALPGVALGIIHTVFNGSPILDALFSEIVGWTFTDELLDSQRTRLPGHKRIKRTP